MLTMFIAGVSAVPVFVISVILQLVFLKPESVETPEARARYCNARKKDLDAVKFHAYL